MSVTLAKLRSIRAVQNVNDVVVVVGSDDEGSCTTAARFQLKVAASGSSAVDDSDVEKSAAEREGDSVHCVVVLLFAVVDVANIARNFELPSIFAKKVSVK